MPTPADDDTDPVHYVRVDLKRLRQYTDGKLQKQEFPSVYAVLETALNALLAAGVLVNEDGSRYPPRARITVDHDGLAVRTETNTIWWSPAQLPPYDGQIAALAYYLAATFNSPSTPGPWPKQLT